MRLSELSSLLNLIILKVFSNLNNSMIHVEYPLHTQSIFLCIYTFNDSRTLSFPPTW